MKSSSSELKSKSGEVHPILRLRLPSSTAFFLAFTAIFAVMAVIVFWGTWSPDFAPVMPDDTVWHPLAFSDQFSRWFREWLEKGVFAPAVVPWHGILISKYWTQEFKYAVCLYASGLGLAYFLRGRGLSRVASYGAGLLLGFCGYWCTLFSAGHGTWFILMASIIPALAFLDRAIVSGARRHWILFGASVGWACGYQQDIFLLFFLLLAAYGIFACVRERKFPWKGGLLAVVMGLLVGAPGIRTAFKDALTGRDNQIAESAGSALTGGKGVVDDKASDAEKAKAADEARWIFVTNWSMPPEDTLEFFVPRIHGDTSCPMTLQLGRAVGKDVQPYTGRLGRPINAPAGNYRQHSLYVGWVTCLLALLGVAGVLKGIKDRRSLSPDVVFFSVAALVFWTFSMGRFCEPVYRLVYHLPFGDYLRAPVKWHHVTEFCLCALAGFGLEALLGWLRSRGLSEKLSLALVSFVAVFGAFDLARNDRIFCAPIDLRLVTGENAAADDAVRLGKGKVCDLVQGGQGLLVWSFNARGLDTTQDPAAPDTRFIFVGNDQVNRTPQLAAWLKGKADSVGCYCLTHSGIRKAPPQGSNVSLYQVRGVPVPAEPPTPPVDGGVLTLGILSFLGTLVAGGCLVSLCRQKG